MQQQVKQPITKKWWFWVIIVILIIGVIGATTNNKSQPTAADDNKNASSPKSNPTENPKSTEAPKATPAPTPTPAPVLSKEGVSSDVKIVVEDFETAETIGDNQYSTIKAQGVFKIVKVTITNNQKDAITVTSANFKLIDDQNRQFDDSSQAQLAMESSTKDKRKSFFLQKVNPGLTVTGYIAYDVPKDAKNFILEASGGITGKKIKLKVE